MKQLLPILLCFLCCVLYGQNRDCDPVILKGNKVNCMLGETPDMLVAFAYESGSWVQIPMQIDEMILLDITAPWGPNDCPYYSYENISWNVLYYCDPKTHIGPDTQNPNFDADDELVFMSKDVGEVAPNNSCPASVVSSTKCELEVKDPIDNSTLGYVYLFRQSGGLDQAAGKDYVSHDFSYANNYKRDYIHCAKLDAGINPENTKIKTDNYEIGFQYRWVEDVLKITAGNANGQDILDRHQMTITLGGCDHNEDRFSSSLGAIATAIDGPVRAIRSSLGANSGPYVQMTYHFTECKVEYAFNFRLHPFKGYYDIYDLSNAASGMKYYNDQNQGGVTINGSHDNIKTTNPNKWELITGNEGTIAVSYEYETDMNVGTVAQYDSGQRQAGVAAYYDDRGSGTGYKCTGDGKAIGSSGFLLKTLRCTDRRYDFSRYPECSPGNVRVFNQWRTHYILPPNQSVSVGSKYGQYAKNRLTANMRAIGACNGNTTPSCNDGIQNGDETGIDCGGVDCPPCSTAPTCDDGIQNGDETGIDCGGADCPPCSTAPTCDDGIQNGDETGIDCGGSDCPPCQNSSCDVPTGLFVSNNTGTSASTNWEAVDEADSYTVRLRQTGNSRWRERESTTTSLVASPLKDGRSYEWQVRANCNTTSSDWSELNTFIAGENEPTCDDGIQNGDETGVDCGGTDCPDCPVPTCDDGIQNGDETGIDCGGSTCPSCPTPTCDTPTALVVNNIQTNRATLSWDAVAEAINYTVSVRPVGTSNWDEGTTNATSAIVRPLAAGSTYEWRVRANCSTASSDWSAIESFTTAASRNYVEDRTAEEVDMLSVDLYPNPTKESLNIVSNQAIEQLEIIDLAGRRVRIGWRNLSDEKIEVAVHTLAAGTYFIRLQTSKETKVLRFVKE
ncbi:MAG: fibronectin type III domain-containing protein [Bacteroidota bacterium]